MIARRYFSPLLLLLLLLPLPLSAEDASAPATAPADSTAASADDGEAEAYSSTEEYVGEEGEIYRLPEAAVTETRATGDLITQEKMEREGAADLWEAVRTVPGVIITGGGQRNDSNFLVRGFGPDSVPIFIDGIPSANTYRGDGDSARLLTGDLEEIEINKGYSSSLLGANTLGGAVQVRTARPQNPFEASLKSSLDFDSLLKYAGNTEVLSVGSKLGLWYGKATFQYRDIDHFRLPASFVPFDDKDPAEYGNPQKAGNRFWSDSTDYKLTLLTGLTPLPGLDVSLTYIMQIADKGFSPPSVYGGRDGYVIWDWPRWDRHSLSLSYAFDNDPWYMKGFTWYGKYDNRLDQYYNWRAYMLEMHLPHSDYDEYAWGSHIEGGYAFNLRHELKAALTFKHEDHKGIDGDIETAHISEDTWSFGAEYSSHPLASLDSLRLALGLGFDALMPRDFSSVLNDYMMALGVKYYIVKSDPRALLSAQAGLFYDITPSHQVSLTYARKNHFPTMSQRYSTRYGEVLPNPRLKAEFANHFEFAYGGYWFEKLRVNSAVYYSEITGKIVSISIADPISPSSSVDYSVNLDRTATYGFELSLEFFPFPWLSAGGAFSLNKYNILHSQLGMEKITYYPESTFNFFAELILSKYLTLIPSVLFTGERYVNVEGTETLGSYALCNLKATTIIWQYFSLSLSIENIFDALYEIRQHFPLGGRTFSLALTAKY